jgi:hypothetical protein
MWIVHELHRRGHTRIAKIVNASLAVSFSLLAARNHHLVQQAPE